MNEQTINAKLRAEWDDLSDVAKEVLMLAAMNWGYEPTLQYAKGYLHALADNDLLPHAPTWFAIIGQLMAGDEDIASLILSWE